MDFSQHGSQHSKNKVLSAFALFSMVVACIIPVCAVTSGQSVNQLTAYFQKVIQLSPEEIQTIENGTAVVKLINTDLKDEIDVFGAIYVNAPVSKMVSFYRDLTQLRNSPGYLAINKFSNPPQLSDLTQFELTEEDIKGLSTCQLADCVVQLPAAEIDALRKNINWSDPNAAEKVNQLFRQGILESLKQYQTGGNAALGSYQDKKDPFPISQQFQTILGSSNGLPIYLPDFHGYLLKYPTDSLTNAETYFYWETVQFGLKPTSRVNQVVIYKNPAGGYAFADKQLYATHYFETAIDLTFCIEGSSQSTTPGFYLITRKASIQQGLTGLKGSIVRKVVTDRTQSSLKDGLTLFKQKLEAAK